MKHETLFQPVEGSVEAGDLTVYAISTCGFCKRALTFLRSHSVRFKYIYVDDLPFDLKDEIKSFLREKFNQQIRYPFVIIDNDRCLIGFTEEEWKKTLGLE